MRRKPADDFHRLSSGKEHPRVCGENTPANEHGFDPRRNIPAYAGKTATHQLSESAETEHPRVCGENPKIRSICCSYTGTSPRMRGKPMWNWWIIVWLQEHPRVCGENGTSADPTEVTSGTSPRMRGKPSPIPVDDPKTRNIPAYAGKTTPNSRPVTLSAEHPRVCGENLGSARARGAACGTSPRMRGKPRSF